jgi:hypothetical protein
MVEPGNERSAWRRNRTQPILVDCIAKNVGDVPLSGATSRLYLLRPRCRVVSIYQQIVLILHRKDNLLQAFLANVLPGHPPTARLLIHQCSYQARGGSDVRETVNDVGPAPTFGSISSSVRRFQLLVVHDHQASLYDFRIDRSPAPVSRLAQRKNRIPSPSQDQRVESKTSRRRSRCCWATPSVSEATIDPQNQILREEHREAVQTKRPIRGFRIEKRARGGYCDALTYSYPLARILPLAQTQVPPTRRQV